MDWNSEEGRALLWKAYPAGYLGKRGVLTVGGWQCFSVYKDRAVWTAPLNYSYDARQTLWFTGEDHLRGVAHRASQGDLLPLPDPSDPATWACLLQDLAEASGRFEHRKPWVGLAFDLWPDAPEPPGFYCWLLTVHDTGGRSFASFTLPASITDADGGAEALVQARIRLRERTA